MIYLLIFIVIFFLFIIVFNILLVIYDKNLKILEKQIILLFEKRTNLLPSLFEITKPYLNKHSEIFSGIIKLRKIEFNNYKDSFLEKINNEILIHHELNFIFKIANKNFKIQRDEKFLLIRDLFLENSSNIGDIIKIYKKLIIKFNFLLLFKNFTIIGLFINIKKRNEI